MKKVDQFVIYQAVGRSAGWLAAASVLAKKRPEDPPHIILMPERHFEQDTFLSDFEACHKKYGWVSVAVGEGVTYADGTPISASRVTDKFSNVEFGAMGGTSAAMMLHRMISDRFKLRGEFQVVESLQMCGADRIPAVDRKEAFQCGVEAVKLVKNGLTGYMVSIQREKGKEYRVSYGTTPLTEVAIKAKPMPDAYINAEGNFVTKAFVDYLKPLVGDLPDYVTLKAKKAVQKFSAINRTSV
jgi:6-phosphofructokinase 1